MKIQQALGVLLLGTGLALGSIPARADVVTLNLGVVDTGLAGFAGTEDDTVTINRINSTTATLTFAAIPNGGLDFLFIDHAGLALNVNATTFGFGSVGSITQLPGFAAASEVGTGSGQVNGFGNFNLVVDFFDGYDHAMTGMSILLTDQGGTWASAADVLTANGDGFSAAAHLAVCTAPCTVAEGAIVTGFAANGPFSVEVPEPSTILMLILPLLIMLGVFRGMNRYPA